VGPTLLDIGLCVPVLNERAVIGQLFDSVEQALPGSRYTICVVDDGSTDGTIEYIEQRAKSDPRLYLLKNRKSGPGCRRGGASRAGLRWLVHNTTHTHFADVDADGANRPEELLVGARISHEQNADVVIASKYVPGAQVTGRPFARRAGSKTYNYVLRALMDWRVHDYSNTFRIYSRRAAELLQDLNPLYDTPVYLVEMVAVWLSHGLRIVEMPTTYVERRVGVSKVLPSDFLRGAAGAVRVGLAYRAGRYR
jgi:dolichol-phosphate mannosyltransferase